MLVSTAFFAPLVVPTIWLEKLRAEVTVAAEPCRAIDADAHRIISAIERGGKETLHRVAGLEVSAIDIALPNCAAIVVGINGPEAGASDLAQSCPRWRELIGKVQPIREHPRHRGTQWWIAPNVFVRMLPSGSARTSCEASIAMSGPCVCP